MVKCLECNMDFENDAGLHRHLRVHKMIMAAYYQKHYPRYDMYDKALIRFKSKDYYFNTDFNTKTNLKAWLENVSQDEARHYLSTYLFNRKERKKLTFAPCQVELRSLPIPGMKYFNELFGSYYQLCDSLGYKLKFTKHSFYTESKDIRHCKIIVDTRERLPLKFNIPTKVDTLKFGDYKLDNENFTCNLYIERKSLPDFYGTLSNGFERFKRELFRAQEAGAYMVVVVESDFESISKFTHLPHVVGKINISPEFILRNMRDIIKGFPNLQFLFVNSREEAVRVIEKLFASNCEYREIDLQYMYDTKEL